MVHFFTASLTHGSFMSFFKGIFLLIFLSGNPAKQGLKTHLLTGNCDNYHVAFAPDLNWVQRYGNCELDFEFTSDCNDLVPQLEPGCYPDSGDFLLGTGSVSLGTNHLYAFALWVWDGTVKVDIIDPQ